MPLVLSIEWLLKRQHLQHINLGHILDSDLVSGHVRPLEGDTSHNPLCLVIMSLTLGRVYHNILEEVTLGSSGFLLEGV